MRVKASYLRRHPSWTRSWWQDFPARRVRFWRTLFWERGQGWLRWAMEERTGYDYIDEGLRAPYQYTVAPPLRRGWCWARAWLLCPLVVWRLVIRGLPWEGTVDLHTGRDRLSWEEVRPAAWGEMVYDRDPDRRRDLWGPV